MRCKSRLWRCTAGLLELGWHSQLGRRPPAELLGRHAQLLRSALGRRAAWRSEGCERGGSARLLLLLLGHRLEAELQLGRALRLRLEGGGLGNGRRAEGWRLGWPGGLRCWWRRPGSGSVGLRLAG